MKTLLNCFGKNDGRRKINVGNCGKGLLNTKSIKSFATLTNDDKNELKKLGSILYDFSANKNIDEISIREGESVEIEKIGYFMLLF